MFMTPLLFVQGDFFAPLKFPARGTKRQILIRENCATRQTDQIIVQRSHSNTNTHMQTHLKSVRRCTKAVQRKLILMLKLL